MEIIAIFASTSFCENRKLHWLLPNLNLQFTYNLFTYNLFTIYLLSQIGAFLKINLFYSTLVYDTILIMTMSVKGILTDVE